MIGGVEIDNRDAVVLARLVGEVDLSNVYDLEATIRRAISARTRGVVLDLTPTSYLDSTGIRMIFSLGRRLNDRRHELRVVADRSSLIRRVLTITQMDEVVPLDETVEDALAALGS